LAKIIMQFSGNGLLFLYGQQGQRLFGLTRPEERPYGCNQNFGIYRLR
jgi:hypothetical protein